MNKQEAEKLIEPHLFNHRGKKAINLESGGLDFESTFIFYGITNSRNVILGDIIRESPEGIETKKRIAKIRNIGNKKTLALGSGRGTDNYYLDLE